MLSILAFVVRNPFVQRMAVAVLTVVLAELTGDSKNKNKRS